MEDYLSSNAEAFIIISLHNHKAVTVLQSSHKMYCLKLPKIQNIKLTHVDFLTAVFCFNLKLVLGKMAKVYTA